MDDATRDRSDELDAQRRGERLVDGKGRERLECLAASWEESAARQRYAPWPASAATALQSCAAELLQLLSE